MANLAVGGTSLQSIVLSAPSATGTYYYGGCVDSVSDEGDTANNCSGSVAVTVTGDPSDRDVLEALYHATGGPSWTDSTNWLYLYDNPLTGLVRRA